MKTPRVVALAFWHVYLTWFSTLVLSLLAMLDTFNALTVPLIAWQIILAVAALYTCAGAGFWWYSYWFMQTTQPVLVVSSSESEPLKGAEATAAVVSAYEQQRQAEANATTGASSFFLPMALFYVITATMMSIVYCYAADRSDYVSLMNEGFPTNTYAPYAYQRKLQVLGMLQLAPVWAEALRWHFCTHVRPIPRLHTKHA